MPANKNMTKNLAGMARSYNNQPHDEFAIKAEELT